MPRFAALHGWMARISVAIALTAISAAPAYSNDVRTSGAYPVGATWVKSVDRQNSQRRLDYLLLCPADKGSDAKPFKVFLSTDISFFKDAPFVRDGLKHPLIIFFAWGRRQWFRLCMVWRVPSGSGICCRPSLPLQGQYVRFECSLRA